MKISAIDKNGNIKEYDAILTYYSEEFDKHYVVYTDDIYNDDKLQIYISSYIPNELETLVQDIENEEEYSKTETIVNELLLTMKNEQEKLEKAESD